MGLFDKKDKKHDQVLAEAQQTTQRMAEELHILRSQYEAEVENRTDVSRRLDQTKLELERAVADAAVARADLNAAKSAEKEARDKECEQCKRHSADLDSLQAKLKKAQDEAAVAKKAAAAECRQCKQHEAELESFRVKAQKGADEAATERKAECDALRAQLADAEDKLAAEKRRADSLAAVPAPAPTPAPTTTSSNGGASETRAAAAEARVEALEGALRQLAADGESRAAGLEAKVKQLDAELSASKQVAEELRTELVETGKRTSANRELEADLESQRRKCEELTVRVKEAEDKCHEAEASNLELRESAAAEATTAKLREAEAKEAQVRCATLQEELVAAAERQSKEDAAIESDVERACGRLMATEEALASLSSLIRLG